MNSETPPTAPLPTTSIPTCSASVPATWTTAQPPRWRSDRVVGSARSNLGRQLLPARRKAIIGTAVMATTPAVVPPASARNSPTDSDRSGAFPPRSTAKTT